MLAKLLHLRLDVAAALKKSDAELVASFVGDGGSAMNADGIRTDLTTLLERGVHFLPIDQNCDNFDPRQGCLGHVVGRAEVAA
jgi:hypothetical protein